MTTLVNTDPVNHAQTIANVFSTLLKVHGAIDAHNLERKIYHLVLLRASQINGCGYCVEMHTKEAREDGETNARLDRLVVWEHVDDFTPRERAAFAWTEALTRLERHTEYGPLRAALRAYYSEEEISALTANITMINLWNRIHISGH
ncbi:carboxymuconolactone decarboxylase family protein [Serratia marcescens]|uniref:carboxymuconolactone decarboxylase family protein n=1 Tax=Serratia marcescens TaxID=615 RepID=UPI0007C95029|nr:carboxymuconolactone decarboxylase family protein [Serratia marcescens]OAH28205.1 alkylhydroperoxidase [Serratia marcescens]